MLLDNMDETINTMNSLRKSGIQFALDNFGMGYSSLQYLMCLRLTQIKIDRVFIRELATNHSDQAIVRTIIMMAQGLDLQIIAEGVVTEEQRAFLMQNGCNNFQGYLYGEPGSAAQLEAMLHEGMLVEGVI